MPQFGGWDQTGPDATNYSVVFSKARANKKQNKAGLRHFSLGSEQELMASARHHHQQLHHRRETQDDDPVMVIHISLSCYLLFYAFRVSYIYSPCDDPFPLSQRAGIITRWYNISPNHKKLGHNFTINLA